MMMRIVADKRCNETWQSISHQGIWYLLKLNEHLDMLDYLERVQQRVQKEQYDRQNANNK